MSVHADSPPPTLKAGPMKPAHDISLMGSVLNADRQSTNSPIPVVLYRHSDRGGAYHCLHVPVKCRNHYPGGINEGPCIFRGGCDQEISCIWSHRHKTLSCPNWRQPSHSRGPGVARFSDCFSGSISTGPAPGNALSLFSNRCPAGKDGVKYSFFLLTSGSFGTRQFSNCKSKSK